MKVFQGVGERIRERLRAIGYVKPNGDLRVTAFCMDKRYQSGIFYNFLNDKRTPFSDLERLSRDLETTPSYLLFGVEAPAPRPAQPMPARSASAPAQPPAVEAPRRASSSPPIGKAQPRARGRRSRSIMLSLRSPHPYRRERTAA